MLDLAVSFFFSNIWTIAFLSVAIYNHLCRPGHKPIIHAALLTAAIFAISHIIYAQWISHLADTASIHYLYLAGSASLLASAIYVNNRMRGFVLYWPVKLAIALMCVEVVLDLLLHVDRNVVALNGSQAPNYAREQIWWLWTFRVIVFNINNVVILVSFCLPISLLATKQNRSKTLPAKLQETMYSSRFSSLSSSISTTMPSSEEAPLSSNVYPLHQLNAEPVVRLSTTGGYRNISIEDYLKEVDQAYTKIDYTKDLIEAMPRSEKKLAARQCLQAASELISKHDQAKIDYIYTVHLLCEAARDLALYEKKADDNSSFPLKNPNDYMQGK